MKPKTFFFYDLETSGVNSRSACIMQFGGVRTDEDFNPIGDPYNVLIKLTEDVLPEPDAVLITGITPQKTLAEGISEAEFAKIFIGEIVQPNTTFVGFNNIRFDDEFMRFFLFRNFYDPYEWQWKEGRSKWDMLDVTRMARALRPDGTEWPFDSSGKPSNRLELLASINKFDHENAHDALSDVFATISLAKHLKAKQPELIDYLLKMRNKNDVKKFVNQQDYFVYSSGKYPGEFEKTTMVANLGPHPDTQGSLVYDLRHDPVPILKLSPEQLAEKWRYNPESPQDRLPVKGLQHNRCPAIAPKGVVDQSSAERIQIDLKQVEKNYKILSADRQFIGNLHKALAILNKDRKQKSMIVDDITADSSLYDDFLPDSDRSIAPEFRSSQPHQMSDFASKFTDQRLQALAPLYIARNFPEALSDDQRSAWQDHCQRALLSGGEKSMATRFEKRLETLSTEITDPAKQYLLEELKLYAQSLSRY